MKDRGGAAHLASVAAQEQGKFQEFRAKPFEEFAKLINEELRKKELPVAAEARV